MLHTILTAIYVSSHIHILDYRFVFVFFLIWYFVFCILIVYCYTLLNHYVKIVWLQISATLRICFVSVLFCLRFWTCCYCTVKRFLRQRSVSNWQDQTKQNKNGGRKIFCMLNFKMLFSDRRSLSHFLNETIKSENNTWKYIIQTQNYSLYCTMYKCNKCIVFVKF